MRLTHAIRALGPIDARNVGRDSLLAWMAGMPLLLGIAARWLLPVLSAWLEADFDFQLAPYRHLIASYFSLLAPMTVGLVIGFLLLDERDDNTLTALLVTPLSARTYVLYRIALPLLLCTAVTAAGIAIADLVTVGWLPLILVLALAAFEAPILSLFLAVFAENKVQGFALVKALGAVLLAPVVAWWVALPWQLLAGLVPSYWPLRAYWSAADPGSAFWIYLGIGFVYHAALLGLLLRRFETVTRR